MLQKLSKCDVKEAFYNLPATQILLEIKFWLIQTVIFGTFRGSEFQFLVKIWAIS